MLCMSSAVHALLRAGGACGSQLHSGESEGRHKNSSAAHTPPTGKHKSPRSSCLLEQRLLEQCSLQLQPARVLQSEAVPGSRITLSVAPKPSCNKGFALPHEAMLRAGHCCPPISQASSVYRILTPHVPCSSLAKSASREVM